MDSLEKCLIEAQKLDGHYGGMASVHTRWHPYECYWYSIADWSNNKRIMAISNTVIDSQEELIRKLKEELNKCQK